MAHTETMLESKEIFNGRVIRVTVDKVQLEDGTTSTREIVHHHGGACILPVDADGNVTMVRQFVYATVGYDSEKIYLWAATGLHEVKQHLDAGEFLDVVKMPFDKALGLVMDGTIKDSKTQVALLKYAQLRDKA